MDMVEQRKSLPQAVPNSICHRQVSRKPSEVMIGPLLRASPQRALSMPQSVSSLGLEIGSGYGTYVVTRKVVDYLALVVEA